VVDLLLVMRGGTAQAFGPRDEVLAKLAPPPQQAPRSDPVARDGSGGKGPGGLVVSKKAGQ
jgi:ABC-type protease/lipase transport system fused ATPase/permease subunit